MIFQTPGCLGWQALAKNGAPNARPPGGAGWLRAGFSRPFPWVPCLLPSQSPPSLSLSQNTRVWCHRAQSVQRFTQKKKKISLTHKRVWVFSFKCEKKRNWSVCAHFHSVCVCACMFNVLETHKQNTHTLSIYWKSHNETYAHTQKHRNIAEHFICTLVSHVVPFPYFPCCCRGRTIQAGAVLGWGG